MAQAQGLAGGSAGLDGSSTSGNLARFLNSGSSGNSNGPLKPQALSKVNASKAKLPKIDVFMGKLYPAPCV